MRNELVCLAGLQLVEQLPHRPLHFSQFLEKCRAIHYRVISRVDLFVKLDRRRAVRSVIQDVSRKLHHRHEPTRNRVRKVAADKRTITIEVSQRTAEALDYYHFLNGVDPVKVASSMVEYCCANSLQHAPDLIMNFALGALNWKPNAMWDRYSTRWDRLESWPAHSALANLAAATEQFRQRSDSSTNG